MVSPDSTAQDPTRELRRLHGAAQALLQLPEGEEARALESLQAFDRALRQHFDTRPADKPVSAEELSILKEVGAVLDRAKALAADRRTAAAGELRRLHQHREGVAAYRANDLLG